MRAYVKGRVFKRGSIWYIDFNANGRRVREAIGENKGLAGVILGKRIAEVVEGKFLDKRNQKIKFEDFADTFINLYSKPNKRSWKSDEYNLKALSPFFNGKYLYEITAEGIEQFKAERSKSVTPVTVKDIEQFKEERSKSGTPATVKDIDQFKAERSKSIAPATVNRELATLKTILNKAVAWKNLRESPARNVKFLREPNGRLRYLEIAEIQRLIANCSDKLRPIVILAVNSGLRLGEILGLRWKENIDFQREIIRITNTKNGEVKALPMNATVNQTLMRVRRNPDSPYVFCGKDGRPYQDIRKSFYTALKKSRIINFRFHDLRHTFASQLLMSGSDINTARELLGHKDLRMTLRYSHLSPDHKKRAVDIFDQKINTKIGTNLAQQPNTEIPDEFSSLELIKNTNVI